MKLLVALGTCCLLFTTGCFYTTDPTPGIPSDTMLWMKMNNSVQDYSDYRHSAVPGRVSYGDGRSTPALQSLSVDGTTTSFVQVDHVPVLALPVAKNVSVSAWIRLFNSPEATRYSQDEYAGIVCKAQNESSGGMLGWQLTIREGNKFNTQFGSKGSFSDVTYEKQALDDGRWHHVVAVFERTTQMLRYYIDGSLVLEEYHSELAQNVDNIAPIRIGLERNSTRPFKGNIDDVRVYYRAINASDVSKLYAEYR
jgi:hypothetical protein